MEFIDETTIYIRSGKGGDGAVVFKRARNVPLGGPTGGDGGDGGSVIMKASRNSDTLLPLARTRNYIARDGLPGGGNFRSGKKADDIYVIVPVGTTVHDESGRISADLSHDGQEVTLACGGKGGKGNGNFRTAENQAPREFTYGGDGLERRLRLELKLIADVGLLGFPNAGKSSLLARFSSARPRVADYPFTTLQPQLGVVSDKYGTHEIVMADIPGIIEGAAEGSGMGLEFLRHIERCRFLVHLVDLSPIDGTTPWDNVHILEEELRKYSDVLYAKPRLLVGNKLDLTGAHEGLELVQEECGKVLGVSVATGEGLDELRAELFRMAASLPKVESAESSVTTLDAGGARVGAMDEKPIPRKRGDPDIAAFAEWEEAEDEEEED